MNLRHEGNIQFMFCVANAILLDLAGLKIMLYVKNVEASTQQTNVASQTRYLP